MDEKRPPDVRHAPDWMLLAATAALIALGLMMVYSSSADLGYRDYGDAAYFFKKQMLFMGAGLVGMFVLGRVRYQLLTKISIPVMVLVLGMRIIVAVSQKGRQLLGQSGSPAEFAKLALIIYIAHWLASKRVEQLRRLPVGPLPFTIIVGVVAGLVMAQPDISEAIVIVLVALVMFFMAGADLLQFVIGIVGGTAAFVLVLQRSETVILRFAPFVIAWKNPITSTSERLDQLREGLIGLGSGGLLGVGPGNGRLSYIWLPAAHTDSIFAVVGEELGFVGCLVLIGLIAFVAYRGFQIARRSPDSFGGLLAVGISSWFAIQALINMAVVTGTIPPSGIALPFISYGGSSLLTSMVGVGILLSISRATVTQGAVQHEDIGVRRGNRRARLPGPDRSRNPA